MKTLRLLLAWILLSLPVLGASPTTLELRIAQTLATNGLITEYKDNASLYRLNNTITRAEVVGLALKVAKVTLPDSYYCRDYFRDVRYNPKNNWVCRAMEMAADRGYISKSNTTARPNDAVTRAEALAIILKAGGYTIPGNTGTNWQTAVVEEGIANGIVMNVSQFGANAVASRIDVFGMVYNMLYAEDGSERWENGQTSYNSAGEKNADKIQVTIGKPWEVTTPMNSASETPAPTVTQQPFARYVVTVPKIVKTQVPFSITIQTVDINGLPVTNFTGPIYLDLIKGEFVYPFAPNNEDNGIGFFPDASWSFTLKGLVIKESGLYELDLYDLEDIERGQFIEIEATDGFLSPSSPNNTTQLGDFIITAPKDVTVNVPFTVEVTAVNPAGKNLTGYMGKIYFGERDNNGNLQILIPKSSYVFVSADKGKKTFTNQFIAKKPGGYELIVFEFDTIPNGLWESVQIMAK